MLTIKGIYENGEVKLLTPVLAKKKIDVIITFLEDVKLENERNLDFSKFSFDKLEIC